MNKTLDKEGIPMPYTSRDKFFNNMKNKYLIGYLLIGIFLFITIGCTEEDDEKAIKPSITTGQVTAITPTTATCGGNIIDDGGASITARGVVWSTEENPTCENNTGITTDSEGTGSFTSNLTGLTLNTTYYVRAYATNKEGTEYGSQQTFKTLDGVIDADGNVYRVITIGTQTWIAENLKVTHYNDGTAIPNITNVDEWGVLTSGAYCWYNNDETTYKDIYGALYNWYTVETGKLCPAGWHVPTDSEWTELTDYIAADGHSGTEGTALKSTTGWREEGNGTDIYGFKALPGGMREYDDGLFFSTSYNGYWWSSTESSSTIAYYRYMWNSDIELYRYNTYKSSGFSVRCLKGN